MPKPSKNSSRQFQLETLEPRVLMSADPQNSVDQSVVVAPVNQPILSNDDYRALSSVIDKTDDFVNSLGTAVQSVIDTIKKNVSSNLPLINGSIDEWQRKFANLAAQAGNGLANLEAFYKENVLSMLTEMKSGALEILKTAGQENSQLYTDINNINIDVLGEGFAAAKEAYTSAYSAWKSASDEVDKYQKQVAEGVDGALDALDQAKIILANTSTVLNEAKDALKALNNTSVDQLRDQLQKEFDKLTGDLKNQIQDKITGIQNKFLKSLFDKTRDVLGDVFKDYLRDVNGDSVKNGQDVGISFFEQNENYISTYDGNLTRLPIGIDSIQVNMNLGQSLTGSYDLSNMTDALGVKGLDAQGKVNATLNWDYSVGVGIGLKDFVFIGINQKLGLDNANKLALVDLNTDEQELQMSFVVDLTDEISLDLSNLTLKGIDKTAGHEVTAGLGINIQNGTSNRITLSNITTTGMSIAYTLPRVDIALDLELGIKKEGFPELSDALPTVTGQFDLNWVAGSGVSIGLNNLQVNLSSATTFLDSLNQQIDTYLGPIIDVATDLVTPNSGLQKLFDLMRIDKPANAFGLIDVISKESHDWSFFTKLVGFATDAKTIVDQIKAASSIQLGSAKLGENRAITANSTAASDVALLNTIKTDYSLDLTNLAKLETWIGLLTNQTVDLVQFTLPQLNINVPSNNRTLLTFGTPIGLINVGVSYKFEFHAQLTLGLDSSGLSQGPSHILHGFYISDNVINGTDNPEAELKGEIGIFGSALGGSIGAGAAIGATLNIDLNDPNQDGKLHYDELLSQDISKLFGIYGSIYGRLYVFVDTWVYENDWTLCEFEIVNYGTAPQLPPPPPVLAHIQNNSSTDNTSGEKALVLNSGRYAKLRANAGDSTDGNENFTVSEDIANNQFIVQYGNHQQKFARDGISKIVFDGGAGNDGLDASGVQSIKVQMDGGAGNDTLKGGQSNNQFVYKGGDYGQDQISGGGSNNTLDFGAETAAMAVMFQRDKVIASKGANSVTWSESQGGQLSEMVIGKGNDTVQVQNFGGRNLSIRDTGGDDDYQIGFSQGGAGTISLNDQFGTQNRLSASPADSNTAVQISQTELRSGSERLLYTAMGDRNIYSTDKLIEIATGREVTSSTVVQNGIRQTIYTYKDTGAVCQIINAGENPGHLFNVVQGNTTQVVGTESYGYQNIEINTGNDPQKTIHVAALSGQNDIDLGNLGLVVKGHDIVLDSDLTAAYLQVMSTGTTTLSNQVTISRQIDMDGVNLLINNAAVINAADIDLNMQELIQVMASASVTASGAIVLNTQNGDIRQIQSILKAQNLSAQSTRGNIIVSDVDVQNTVNLNATQGSVSQVGGVIHAQLVNATAGAAVQLNDVVVQDLHANASQGDISLANVTAQDTINLNAVQGSVNQLSGILSAPRLNAVAGRDILLAQTALDVVDLNAQNNIQIREKDDLIVSNSISNRLDIALQGAGHLELIQVLAQNRSATALVRAQTADGDLLVGLVQSDNALDLQINGRVVENIDDEAADLVAQSAHIFHQREFKLETQLSTLDLEKYGVTNVDFKNFGDLTITRMEGDVVIPAPQIPQGDELVDYTGITGVANQSALSTYKVQVANGSLTLQNFENHAKRIETRVDANLNLDSDISSHGVYHYAGASIQTFADRTYNSEKHYYSAVNAHLQGNFTGKVSDFTLDHTGLATIDIADLTTAKFVAQYGGAIHVQQLSGQLAEVTLSPNYGDVIIDNMDVNSDWLNIMPAHGNVTIKNLSGNLNKLNIIPADGWVKIERITGQIGVVNISTQTGAVTIDELAVQSKSISIRAQQGAVNIGNIHGQVEQLYVASTVGDLSIDRLSLTGNQLTQVFAYQGNITKGVIDTGSSTAYFYASGSVISTVTQQQNNVVVLGGIYSSTMTTLTGDTQFRIDGLSAQGGSKIVVSIQAMDMQYLTGTLSGTNMQTQTLNGGYLYYTTFTIDNLGQASQLFLLQNATGRAYDLRWWYLP